MEKQKIRGLVTAIVDGNTFEISVQVKDGADDPGVKQVEQVRIHGMDKPATSTLPGILAKLELEKMIVGRTLECEVIDRDDLNQLVAIVPQKYLKSPFAFDSQSES